MSSIDNRIVKMKFDNAAFESAAKTTMATLEKLKSKLSFKGAAESFKGIEIAASNVDFSGMEQGIASVNTQLDRMGIIQATVIGEVTKTALNAGRKVVNAVIGPLVQGGKNRAMNIEQARFKLEGLGVVGKDLEDIWGNVTDAVDGTAYSLDAAALVAAQLAASGMRGGDEMARSLRAISGVASVTGSSYEDVGRIFTQVAGQGKVMGDQLLQLSGRGMNAAATLAKELGKSEAEVRDMVSKGKIDFQTFADAMNNAFGDAASKANQSLTGILSNVRSALAKIGADFFTPFITNTTTEGHVSNLVEMFGEIRLAINQVRTSLGPLMEAIQKPALAIIQTITKLFAGLTEVEGFSRVFGNIAQTLANVINALVKPLNAVFKAFGDIFKAKDLADLLGILTEAFAKFTSHLVMSDSVMNGITSIFHIFFSVLRVGFRAVIPVLEIAVYIFDRLLGVIQVFADVVLRVLTAPFKMIDHFFNAIAINKDVVEGWNKITTAFRRFGEIYQQIRTNIIDSLKGFIDALIAPFEPLKKLVLMLRDAFEGGVATIIGKALQLIGSGLEFVTKGILGFLKGPGRGIVDFFKSLGSFIGNFLYTPFKVVGDICTTLTNALGKFFGAVNDFTGPKIKGFFDWLNKGFTGMGKSINECGTSVSKWWDTICNAVSGFFGGIWNSIRNFNTALFDKIGSFFGNFGQSMKDFMSGSGTKILGWFKTAGSTISKWYETCKPVVQSWFNTAVTTISDWYQKTKPIVEQWVGETSKKIVDWYQHTSPVFVKWAGETWETLKGWGSRVLDFLKEIWKGMVGLFTGQGFSGFNNIGETFKGIFSGFDPKQTMGSVKESIVTALSDKDISVDALKRGTTSFFDKVIDYFRVTWTALRDYMSKVDWGSLTPVFESIRGFFKAFGDTFNNAFKTITDPEKIKAFIDDLLSIAMKMAQVYSMFRFAKLEKSISGFFGSCSDFINSCKKQKTGFASFADSLKSVVKSLTLLAGVVVVLSLMNPMDLVKGLGSLVGMLAALSAVMILFSRNRIIQNPSAMADASKGMVRVAASMALLLIPIKSFSKMKINEYWAGFYKLAGALIVVSTALALLSRNKIIQNPDAVDKATKGMQRLSLSLALLVIPIKILGHMDFGQLCVGIFGVGSAMLALSTAMVVIGKSGNTTGKAAKGLVSFAVALTILVIPIKMMGEMDYWALARGLGSVGLLMVGLTLSLSKLAQNAFGVKYAAQSMLKLAEALLLLSVPVLIFGRMDFGHLIQGMAAVAVGLGAMTLAMIAIAKWGRGGLGAGKAMIEMAVALLILTVPLLILEKISWETMGKGLAFLAVSLGGFALVAVICKVCSAGLMALAGACLGIGVVLIAAAAAMGLFLGAVALIAEKGPELGAKIVDFFASMVTELAAKAFDIGKAIPTAIAMGVAGCITGAIDGIASAFMSFLDGVGSIIGKVGNWIGEKIHWLNTPIETEASKAAKELATNMEQSVENAAAGVNAEGAAEAISDNLDTAMANVASGDGGQALAEKAAEGAKTDSGMEEAGAEQAGNFLSGMTGEEFQNELKSLGLSDDVVKQLSENSEQFEGLGGDLSSMFSGSFGESLPEDLNGVLGGLGNTLDFSSLKDKFASTGRESSADFGNGFKQNAKLAEDGANEVVRKARKAIEDKSTDFKTTGETIVKSLADGMKQALDREAVPTAKSAVDSIGEKLSDNTDQITIAGKSIAYDFCQGISKGVEENLEGAISTIDQTIRMTFENTESTAEAAGKKVGIKYSDGLANSGSGITSGIQTFMGTVDVSLSAYAKTAYNQGVATGDQFVEGIQNGFSAPIKTGVLTTAILTMLFTTVGNLSQDSMRNSGMAQGNAFVSGINGGICGPNSSTQISNAIATLSTTLSSTGTVPMTNGGDKLGGIIIESLSKGILKGLPTTTSAISTVCTGLIATGVNALAAGAKSFLVKGVECARAFANGLSDLTARKSAANAATQLASTAARAMKGDYGFHNAGLDAAKGFANGIKAGQSGAINAAANMAASALSGAKKALESKSPSKKFMRLGEDSDRGMIIGFQKLSGAVSNAAANVSKEALDAVRDGVVKAKDLVSQDSNFNPVIKPVLDLSEIQNGSGRINDLLNADPLNVSGSIGQISAIARSMYRPQVVVSNAPTQAPGDQIAISNTFHISGAQDPNKIADRVSEKIAKQLERRNLAW